jgi:hypothetical protein
VAAASAAGAIRDAAKAASTFWRPATERPKWLRLQPQVRFASLIAFRFVFGRFKQPIQKKPNLHFSERGEFELLSSAG